MKTLNIVHQINLLYIKTQYRSSQVLSELFFKHPVCQQYTLILVYTKYKSN